MTVFGRISLLNPGVVDVTSVDPCTESVEVEPRYADDNIGTESKLEKALLAIFLLIVVLVMLNMLIGAMSHTYSEMVPHIDQMWTASQSRAVLWFETYMSSFYANWRIKKYTQYDKETKRFELMIVRLKSQVVY